MRLQEAIWAVLEPAHAPHRVSRAFDLAIQVLIVLNVAMVMCESVENLHSRFAGFFAAFEFVSVGVFSVEYALRLYSCTASDTYRGALRGRLRFALTPIAIIDFLSIAPAYVPFMHIDLRFLRIFRIVRIARLAKLARYSRALQTLRRVIVSQKEELGASLGIVLILLIVASCMVYFAEHGAQPEAFPSIPSAMWWAVATLTTVGYGDVYPVTLAGKLLTSLMAALGIGMFALPAGLLASGFIEECQARGGSSRRCPHCGQEI